MTDDEPVPTVLALEPADLDGHTIEELSEYLDRGREPRDAAIEGSPACRIALAALERLQRVSADFLDDEAAAEPAVDDDWVAGVLAAIRLDSSAGRDFAVLREDGVTVLMTEGALRALVRAVGDDVPGFLIGRVRFSGDLDAPGPLTIAVDVHIVHGYAIPDAVDALRAAVVAAVLLHTRFTEFAVDVAVRDVHVRRSPGREDLR